MGTGQASAGGQEEGSGVSVTISTTVKEDTFMKDVADTVKSVMKPELESMEQRLTASIQATEERLLTAIQELKSK